MGDSYQTLSQWLNGQEPAGQQQKPPASPLPSDQGTILIIDDEPDFLNIVSTLLWNYGYNILAASSGLRGLNMLRHGVQDIHLVLLDYRMSGFDGEQTLQQLRRLNPHVKVIAVTGVSSNELPESFRNGTDYLIQKPVKSEVLLATIKEALAASTVDSKQS